MTPKIPYCPAFADKSIEQVNALLDDAGLSLSIDKLNWQKQYPYRPITSVYLARTDDMLYIKWHVNGIMLKAVYTEDNSDVYKDSCVEFFCLLPDAEIAHDRLRGQLAVLMSAHAIGDTEDGKPLSHFVVDGILIDRRPEADIRETFRQDRHGIILPLPAQHRYAGRS